VVGGDEAVALLVREPLDRSFLGHALEPAFLSWVHATKKSRPSLDRSASSTVTPPSISFPIVPHVKSLDPYLPPVAGLGKAQEDTAIVSGTISLGQLLVGRWSRRALTLKNSWRC
jgi:hypothetical protein